MKQTFVHFNVLRRWVSTEIPVTLLARFPQSWKSNGQNLVMESRGKVMENGRKI